MRTESNKKKYMMKLTAKNDCPVVSFEGGTEKNNRTTKANYALKTPNF